MPARNSRRKLTDSLITLSNATGVEESLKGTDVGALQGGMLAQVKSAVTLRISTQHYWQANEPGRWLKYQAFLTTAVKP